MKIFPIIFVALVALITAISPVYAGTATGALDIRANLLSSCSVSTGAVDFGAISSPSNAPATAGVVVVNCQSGLPYHISLDAGTNYSGGSQYRSLVNGGGSLISYNLSKLSGETWGDSDQANTFNFGSSLADTSDGSEQVHPVIGTLQGGSMVPGVYVGTVQVTVDW